MRATHDPIIRWFGFFVGVLTIWGLSLVIQGWMPFGDHGLAAMAIIDVFSVHTPTTGMPSTAFFDLPHSDLRHIGPLHFQLLAPIYALGGYQPWALIASSVVFSSVIILAALHVAHRAGGLLGVRIAGFTFLGTLVMTPILVMPWNPAATVVGSGLTVFAAWGIVNRRQWMWPWFAFGLSLASQAHLGAVAPMGVLALLILALSIVGAFRYGFAWTWREILVTIAVIIACWAIPVWGVLRAPRNNLSELVAWLSARDSTVSDSASFFNVALSFALLVLPACASAWTWRQLRQVHGPTADALRSLVLVNCAMTLGITATLFLGGWGNRSSCFISCQRLLFPSLPLPLYIVCGADNDPST